MNILTEIAHLLIQAELSRQKNTSVDSSAKIASTEAKNTPTTKDQRTKDGITK